MVASLPTRMTIFTRIVLLANLLVLVNNLNLKSYGIGDTFYASSVAVFRNRAFLTLPRSSCYNNFTQPTLIEVHWNAEHTNLIAGRKLFFPSEKYHQWGKCDRLQDGVSVEVEVKKARLWVLDKGSKKCPPKLVIYNLHTNTESYTIKFDKELVKNVNSMVIDSVLEFGTMAYIGHSKLNLLTVYSLTNKKWWTVTITDQNGTYTSISTERLVLSKTEPILYLTRDNGSEMFYINLTEIRKPKPSETLTGFQEINAMFIGYKLGPTGGMIADLAGGLNYYLTRDFVVLRWQTGKPLKAEYYDVLRQSYEVLPYVSYLFNGPQNSVWALVNPVRPQECINITERKYFKLPEKIPYLQRRAVKLFKLTKKGHGKNVLQLEKP